MQKPFIWGETDCCATADRWVQQRLGFSPLDHFGRRHASEAEARAWMAERGDMAGAVLRVLRKSGLPHTQNARPGAIGLVVSNKRFCMAIFTGSLWFSRNENGLIGCRQAVRIWNLDLENPDNE